MAHVNNRSPSRLYLMNVRGRSWPFRRIGLMLARAHLTQTPAKEASVRGERQTCARRIHFFSRRP